MHTGGALRIHSSDMQWVWEKEQVVLPHAVHVHVCVRCGLLALESNDKALP